MDKICPFFFQNIFIWLLVVAVPVGVNISAVQASALRVFAVRLSLRVRFAVLKGCGLSGRIEIQFFLRHPKPSVAWWEALSRDGHPIHEGPQQYMQHKQQPVSVTYKANTLLALSVLDYRNSIDI